MIPWLCAVIWRSLLRRQTGQILDGLDFSSLAKITDGYTPGHIQTAIEQVLSERRIQQVYTVTS